jgi:phospho-N-acetylmuramoyl-pentapeptide-transferase
VLYNLLYPLSDYFALFNVFKYITFRTAYAIITSFLFALIFGPIIINFLKNLHIEQRVKGYEPERHKMKEGTPTMGGLLIIISVTLSAVLWSDLRNIYVWLVIFIFISMGILGFYDDYIKTFKRNPVGLNARTKLLCEILLSFIVVYFIVKIDTTGNSTKIALPFFKDLVFDLSYFYYVLAIFVIVGTSNAVNLTDGLDGLAIMPSVIAFGTFIVFVYVAGNVRFSEYLDILYVRNCGELAIFCGAMVGGGLGFLWFNAYPASVIMGDMGSLSIGGALGTISVISKQEVVLAIVGFVFVVETLSVILQIGFFRATSGKRLFKMAPIHHHFEMKNWSEPKIIVRFWIISFIFALIALSTLKLR